MAPHSPRRRGRYPKGAAKREEILRTALDVIAKEGYRGASVRRIAAAVGLSQAGVLHYFDSKEELFAEILRTRDEVDAADQLDPERLPPDADPFTALKEGFLAIVRHNADAPGAVELFTRTSVDAADPDHPAHRHFLDRGHRLRAAFADAVRAAQDEGRIAPDADPDALARLLQAAADGLQLQWLIDRDVDMAANVSALFDLIEHAPRAP